MTLQAARDAGEALHEIRERVGRGNWTEWVEDNFDATIQTARKYIKIFEHWEDKKLADQKITIEKACKVIAGFPDEDYQKETKLDADDGPQKKQEAASKPEKKDRVLSIELAEEHEQKLQQLKKARKEKDEKKIILALIEEAAQ